MSTLTSENNLVSINLETVDGFENIRVLNVEITEINHRVSSSVIVIDNRVTGTWLHRERLSDTSDYLARLIQAGELVDDGDLVFLLDHLVEASEA
jgi:hypothetical protein